MRSSALHGLSRARLRWTLGLLFVALAVPSAVLVVQTQRQLKWEAFHRHRQQAVELAERIDAALQRQVAAEEARGVADYGFLTVAGGTAQAPLLQRSPLAAFPPPDAIPGLLGWFQVDATGAFSSPLLPEPPDDAARLGLSAAEFAARRTRHELLFDVLGRNRLAERHRPRDAAPAADAVLGAVVAAPRSEAAPAAVAAGRQAVDADAAAAAAEAAERDDTRPTSGRGDAAKAPRARRAEPPAASQFAFDRLKEVGSEREQGAGTLGNVADLRLDESFAGRAAPQKAEPQAPVEARARRVEQAVLPASPAPAAVLADAPPAPLTIFDSELDPFELARLDSGHFVLFRRIWRDGERSIQGALIEQAPFLQATFVEPFATSALAPTSDLLVAWRGDLLQQVPAAAGSAYVDRADALHGTLLHRARLSAPLADMELIWTVRALPAGAGASLVAWTGLVLFAVLLAGFVALYRLGLRQLALAQQQRDFIAAVSHELKTPLTSIRMYGELLRAGWASEDKKREYYDYIHDEAERLSRLIANVLQLARLGRDELQLELRRHPVSTLFDLIRSKVQAPIARAGFDVEFTLDPACADDELLVDADALAQIMINLVDNALKFSAQAPQRRLEIAVDAQPGGQVAFRVRDHGPGVSPALRRRIFELFFRGGDALATPGTGIGLALVRQLAQAMGGTVEVAAAEPGAEFRLLLPLAAAADVASAAGAPPQ